jgi:hypothetical protein
MPHLLAKHSSYVSNIQFGSSLGPSLTDLPGQEEGGPGRVPGKPGKKESSGAARRAVKPGRKQTGPGRKQTGPGRMAERPGQEDAYLASTMLDLTQSDLLTDSSLLDFRGRGS